MSSSENTFRRSPSRFCSKTKWLLVFLGGLMFCSPKVRADYTIRLITEHGQFDIPAEEKKDRIFIDIVALAHHLESRFSFKKKILIIKQPQRQIAINVENSFFSIRLKHQKKW